MRLAVVSWSRLPCVALAPALAAKPRWWAVRWGNRGLGGMVLPSIGSLEGVLLFDGHDRLPASARRRLKVASRFTREGQLFTCVSLDAVSGSLSLRAADEAFGLRDNDNLLQLHAAVIAAKPCATPYPVHDCGRIQ